MCDAMAGRIFEGLVIGISSGIVAGVVVSIILSVNKSLSAILSRHKEIRQLRGIIKSYIPKIYPATGTIKDKATFEQDRKILFDFMVEDLRDFIKWGSPNLSYKEKKGIRDIIFDEVGLIGKNLGVENPDKIPLNTEWYDFKFERLENLKWLKLSSDLRKRFRDPLSTPHA